MSCKISNKKIVGNRGGFCYTQQYVDFRGLFPRFRIETEIVFVFLQKYFSGVKIVRMKNFSGVKNN